MTSDHSVNFKDAGTYYVGYNLFTLERIGPGEWSQILRRARLVSPNVSGNGRSCAVAQRRVRSNARRVRLRLVQTRFTILFLSRGRHPVFMEKLWFTGSWANRPRDLANVTRFASARVGKRTAELGKSFRCRIHGRIGSTRRCCFAGIARRPPALQDARHRQAAQLYPGPVECSSPTRTGRVLPSPNSLNRNLASKLFRQYAFQDVPANESDLQRAVSTQAAAAEIARTEQRLALA